MAHVARPPARRPVALSVLTAVSPRTQFLVWSAALESLFYFYATGSLIAYMLQDWVATTDELFAAGATFTLLAWAFAYAYVVCEAVFPGSFAAAGSAADARTWMVESFAGVMYIALVVSRLIGNATRQGTGA